MGLLDVIHHLMGQAQAPTQQQVQPLVQAPQSPANSGVPQPQNTQQLVQLLSNGQGSGQQLQVHPAVHQAMQLIQQHAAGNVPGTYPGAVGAPQTTQGLLGLLHQEQQQAPVTMVQPVSPLMPRTRR